MKTPSFSLSASILAASAALALSGCSTVSLDQTGETTAVYQFNEFRMVLNSTAPVAFAATQKAVRELDLFETKSKLNTYDGELFARSRKDDKIHVTIAEINSRQTMLTIQWGTTGDKKNSTALYKSIESHLR